MNLKVLYRNEDGTCRRGTLAVESAGDGSVTTEDGDRLRQAGYTEIMGWGDLDGPAAIVSTEIGAWEALVPERYWDRLEAPKKDQKTS